MLADTGSSELGHWMEFLRIEDERRLEELRTFGLSAMGGE